VSRPRSGEVDCKVSRRQTLSALETLFTTLQAKSGRTTQLFIYYYFTCISICQVMEFLAYFVSRG